MRNDGEWTSVEGEERWFQNGRLQGVVNVGNYFATLCMGGMKIKFLKPLQS
jgi:hypothetical protein